MKLCLAALILAAALLGQSKSLLIEDLTWTEVRDAIASGKTTAIYYAASIEENGPGVALGKHLFIEHDLPVDNHAGTDDTSEVMFFDKDHKWIRRDKLVNDTGKLGVKGDQTKATPEMGEIFINYKIKYAVDQIRQLLKQ